MGAVANAFGACCVSTASIRPASAATVAICGAGKSGYVNVWKSLECVLTPLFEALKYLTLLLSDWRHFAVVPKLNLRL